MSEGLNLEIFNNNMEITKEEREKAEKILKGLTWIGDNEDLSNASKDILLRSKEK